MQNSIYKIKYLLFLSWDWEAWCLTIWEGGNTAPPPERNTAWNKGRKCFHCLGAPNNLIRPWADTYILRFIWSQKTNQSETCDALSCYEFPLVCLLYWENYFWGNKNTINSVAGYWFPVRKGTHHSLALGVGSKNRRENRKSANNLPLPPINRPHQKRFSIFSVFFLCRHVVMWAAHPLLLQLLELKAARLKDPFEFSNSSDDQIHWRERIMYFYSYSHNANLQHREVRISAMRRESVHTSGLPTILRGEVLDVILLSCF